ncbi:MAG: DEAD/DEAH box helicase [Candidatus Schekmanbacteria bacterium]|nr:DEAD/DEAH box helicase [Candidatus Schekmanbacteria bacterium]
MNVFDLRDRLITDYENFIQSFINIQDNRIKEKVNTELREGLLWPEPLIQLNPSFEPGESIEALINANILHSECLNIFRKGKTQILKSGTALRLYKHQTDAIKIAKGGHNYILTTGTGSGKSLAYIIPIVDYVLRHGSGKKIKAIIIYPMNALANSQAGELEKFLGAKGLVTFARYTGQETDEERQQIIANPPDILLTNYVMLELILTRPDETPLVNAANGLRYLVLDELHTYRGRQGADVAMLVRRCRNAFAAEHLQCIGTSATLAGSGSYKEQCIEVAQVASKLFGADVKPEHVIGETLRRVTPDKDINSPEFIAQLSNRLQFPDYKPALDYSSFINDPLSVWIETVFGITADDSGRLIRSAPRSITGPEGVAKKLSELTNTPLETCAEAVKQQFLASYRCEPNSESGFPVFAFRLHQFISRGDTVYASLESEEDRTLTVNGQRFVPGDRNKVLLPLVFCRECGQEYYCVSNSLDQETKKCVFAPRELSDRMSNEEGEAGFLYLNNKEPWTNQIDELVQKLPDDWLEEHKGMLRVRRDRQQYLPQLIKVNPGGQENREGIECHYLTAPFRLCLSCGVSYDFHQSSDFAKLASLGSEGRSTATTILSLSTIRYLRYDTSIEQRARKLLSFTDNRQDASLQSGHFNDFIEVGLLRSVLLKAIVNAGITGLRHDELVQRVFDALDMPLKLYATDPDVRFQALYETNDALRSVLGYRLYRDLKRGWRITAPNLEQCGLLEIKYLSLEDVCAAEDVWYNLHPALTSASPQTRQVIAKTLLDFMRRELAIKVDYLDKDYQSRIQQQSSQRLIPPWAIDENEKMEHAAMLFPRSRTTQDYRGNVYLSPRGGFGQYLRRSSTFPDYGQRLTLEETQIICNQLLEALRIGGLVKVVLDPRNEEDVPGYQLPASAFVWNAGDGMSPFHDPIRVPMASKTGGHTNPFFIDFYRKVIADGKELEAREHTAQVEYDLRMDREKRFREGRLPVLYCSPTMELGVDIAELNVVNMRNMPPTPANYAQRSGRAGRSGQPALVFSYCSTFSSHDQYFFKRPEQMVSGAITPPQIDLTNEDLIRAHIHAIWLTETKLSLRKSLKELLSLEGEEPSLELTEEVRDAVYADFPRQRAYVRAKKILTGMLEELNSADWYSDNWLDEVLTQVGLQFDRSCERWRDLYKAAKKQLNLQHRISVDVSKSIEERNKARRLRKEAESQIDLLIETKDIVKADFYSYRYFASEGFLPGYNFPRLPLSAYIPGRRQKTGNDEFLSRPRFLAISEFGPRTIIYHEGSRYRINRVLLSFDVQQDGPDLLTTSAKQCDSCGYLHPILQGNGLDLCERCGKELESTLYDLFRLKNVSTARVDKINSDEEERMRLGYELKTGIRFVEHGVRSCHTAKLELNGTSLATIIYGQAATLWRINLGWMRRANKNQYGFVLDTERGYWAKNSQDEEDDTQDPLSAQTKRVIPYVEDRRNCLLFEPDSNFIPEEMASLQAALKNAIQIKYQLEESELAVEPLPSRDNRQLLLFYEAAEGGAGVLRRIVDDPAAMGEIARKAMELCHFDPDTGEDKHKALRSRENCEAACYDCLMCYTNQADHLMLDRHRIKGILQQLTQAQVKLSPTNVPRSEHLTQLMRQCQSDLERRWLQFLEDNGLNLPSKAQCLIKTCNTRPDFLYENSQTAIYIDGPHHEYQDRQKRDACLTENMEDCGYLVVRFKHSDNWKEIIALHQNIFGSVK